MSENDKKLDDLGVENAPHIDKYMENKEQIDDLRKGGRGNKLSETTKLTLKEQKILDYYMIYADPVRALEEAGVETKQSPYRYFSQLKRKPHFKKALEERRQEMQKDSIMSAQEVMEYLTAVVRGEVKDQFGLDAPLSERTKAALEIAKRTIDIEIKEKEKQNNKDTDITIKLEWDRD